MITKKCIKVKEGVDYNMPIRELVMEKAEDLHYMVNLGCGKNILKNFINIDVVKLPGVDIVTSLEKAHLPFSDNSVQIVKCKHILEHIENLVG